MGAVSLDYAAPSADVAQYLSVFYEFRADAPIFQDTERAAIAQVRFILEGSEGVYVFADGSRQLAPLIHILGPTTGPTATHITGPVHLFGAGLLPSGWGALLDFEASLLVNRAIDATELFGNGLYVEREAMRAAHDMAGRVAIGTAIAHRLIARGNTRIFDFTRIVDDWLSDSPSPDVDVLVAATGLSRRHVERKCNACYGLPPKILSRKYRALKAAMLIARNEPTGDLADFGFYDQSHMIREIKRFTGVTPSRLVDELPMLATLMLKRGDVEGIASITRDV